MLLLHQAGSVKIGEVVRYTITYTPANDHILPPPVCLFLKVKNTSAIALRAAFVHGPYTLYVSSAPTNFDPNKDFNNPRRDGVPEFEPHLKAGGVWQSQLCVPENIRKTVGSVPPFLAQEYGDDCSQVTSVSWVIEIASQVVFSASAAVHYEILLGRDEKSLLPGVKPLSGGNGSGGNGSGNGLPGQVRDHQRSQGANGGLNSSLPKGVYSRAIKLTVDDTASLWNNPKFPELDNEEKDKFQENGGNSPIKNVRDRTSQETECRRKRPRKVHLVILTHGLHSNLGADMLYLKESIDAAAKQAKEDAKIRRSRRRGKSGYSDSVPDQSHIGHPNNKQESYQDVVEPTSAKRRTYYPEEDGNDEVDEEEVIVRGFSGNAARTEKGIKYLGKRLAQYVLAITYPDQPFRPIGKNAVHSLSTTTRSEPSRDSHPSSSLAYSSSPLHKEQHQGRKPGYCFTSISFIAHSLGGLVQTYAIAYIQKHSPEFFESIKPINFITLATPFLGLSNENPLYVKFALDFGLVGRTGQDLGLTWRAPTLARSGWGAIVSSIGEFTHSGTEGYHDPRAKPLLRILPTGPAHFALKKFRNRTVYSNVVNDGIVPLRTSCLLFLDWQGLGRVEKARRENGLVGTVAEWGWAELTGANANTASPRLQLNDDADELDDTGTDTPTHQGKGDEVPQPSPDEVNDDARSLKNMEGTLSSVGDEDTVLRKAPAFSGRTSNSGVFDGFLGIFRSNPSSKPQNQISKHSKIYKRSQTIKVKDGLASNVVASESVFSTATSGGIYAEGSEDLATPPKTTFFEAAGDLLSPPFPPITFIIDPSSRPRTIFHDRLYRPEDIPPPPLKRKSNSRLSFRPSGQSALSNPPSPISLDDKASSSGSHCSSTEAVDRSAMKVEEKIARAYHRDLSWRKVLVRLEPDAHNNIIVRRKFANAYGWPVIKHLVDTHFSDQATANIPDDKGYTQMGAKGINERSDDFREVEHLKRDANEQGDKRFHPRHARTESEKIESSDRVSALYLLNPSNLAKTLDATSQPSFDKRDSVQWSDDDFMDSDGDSDADRLEPGGSPKSPSSPSSGGWNWTEAIAGRGATSSRGGRKRDVDTAHIGGSALKVPGHDSVNIYTSTTMKQSEGSDTVVVNRLENSVREGCIDSPE